MEKPKRWPADAVPIKSPKVTLIVVVDGLPYGAWNVGQKRTLIEETTEPVYAVWAGKYAGHLFEIDRAQAELEVCTGPGATREVDPGVEALLTWFVREAGRQGLLIDHVSHSAGEVSAAKRLLANVPKGKIAAVAQFALVDERHRRWIHTVESLNRGWNRVLADWEQAGSPAFDPDYVREGE